jgi:hypothetical protein
MINLLGRKNDGKFNWIDPNVRSKIFQIAGTQPRTPLLKRPFTRLLSKFLGLTIALLKYHVTFGVGTLKIGQIKTTGYPTKPVTVTFF